MNRVSNAGDINHDGANDYLIGIPGANSDAGSAFIISGKVAMKGAPEAIELFRVEGNPGDGLGSGICTLGDINGDGYADFAVSASAGQYVNLYSGLDGAVLGTIIPDSTLVGVDYAKSLTTVDLNGDGVIELAVGDPSFTDDGFNHTGSVEMYELRTLLDQSVQITSLARMTGVGENWFGADLDRIASGSSADYLLVGAPRMTQTPTQMASSGTVQLLRDDPLTAGYDLQSILVIEDTTTQNMAGQFGISVASVGDLRGNDGVDEFVIGAPALDANGTGTGTATVYDVDGNLILSFAGTTSLDGLGLDVTGMGDADGDLIPDFAVSAPGLEGGPGKVYIFSGADGATLDTLTGGRLDNHFGMALASAGDVDGDGSRDVMIADFDPRPGFSTVRIMRPLHSFPYRIAVNATPNGTDFAPVHGVTHGPLHKGKWSKRFDLTRFYMTNFDGDFTKRYIDLKIPNARLSAEGVGDMNYLWNVEQIDPGNFKRNYNLPLAEMANIDNYSFHQMDERMDAVENMPDHDTIWRIGHDKAINPDTNEWMDGFHETPNNIEGFAAAVAGVMKHYNQGWGRALPNNPIRYVELWNEPHLDSFTGTAAEFADMHIQVLAALDRELDQNGDGLADELTMLTPIAPGLVGGFSEEFLNTLDAAFDPLNPQKTRLGGVVGHFYGNDPMEFMEKMEYYDDLFRDMEENRNILKTGPGMQTEWPKIWVTEWNRSIESYAFSYASMPFIMNTLFYMNQVSAGEAKRHDGADLKVELGGAQFFGPRNMWRAGINPATGQLENLAGHSGLAWEVYGKTLYQEASKRLNVEGPFHEGKLGDETNPIKDFTVMAGRSATEELVVLVVSSMNLQDRTDHPNHQDQTKRLPYVVDVDSLGFVPQSIERQVQKADRINFRAGEGATLVSIPEFGSSEYPYTSWTSAIGNDKVTVSVNDMIENSYEVIVIRGAPAASGPDAPGSGSSGGSGGNTNPPQSGLTTTQIVDPGEVSVGRNQITDLNAGNVASQPISVAAAPKKVIRKKAPAKKKAVAKKSKPWKSKSKAKKKSRGKKSKANKKRGGRKSKAKRSRGGKNSKARKARGGRNSKARKSRGGNKSKVKKSRNKRGKKTRVPRRRRR
ncbi:MAG: VCBS repeat-containing protein [Planctomycetota bacterium]